MPKAEYTAEFKELGLIEQTRRNWVKAFEGSALVVSTLQLVSTPHPGWPVARIFSDPPIEPVTDDQGWSFRPKVRCASQIEESIRTARANELTNFRSKLKMQPMS